MPAEDGAKKRGVDHLYGEEVWSEAVHMGAVSEDGLAGINARICRYPTEGASWMWAHAYTPDGFFAFTDHYAGSSREKLNLDAAAVTYRGRTPAAELAFVRSGPRARPAECRLEAEVMARRSRKPEHGTGSVPLSISATFEPRRGYEGMRPGRTELGGRAEVKLRVAGREVFFDGPAQFHEQPRLEARFTYPFTYCTLWGETMFITAAVYPIGGRGYVVDGEVSTDIADFEISRPGPDRHLRLSFEGGNVIEAIAHVRQMYAIPVYDKSWRGSMVTTDIGGEKLYGNINDYMSEDGVYRLKALNAGR